MVLFVVLSLSENGSDIRTAVMIENAALVMLFVVG